MSDTGVADYAPMRDCSGLRPQIAGLFREQLSLDVPTYDTDLLEGGILDSLKFVELLTQLEQQFGIQFNLNELEADNFRSIDRIAEFLMSCS
jgi:acyl carrier protein